MLNGMGWRRQSPRYYLSGLFVSFLLLSSDARLDPQEVTNRQYRMFVLATGHSPPVYWPAGHYPEDMADLPVVLVTWYEAADYCKWAGDKRLPSADEWMEVCRAGELAKQGDVWEWTSTELPTPSGTFMALCGPMGVCDCSHRYRPDWKNAVKGFRCMGGTFFSASASPHGRFSGGGLEQYLAAAD